MKRSRGDSSSATTTSNASAPSSQWIASRWDCRFLSPDAHRQIRSGILGRRFRGTTPSLVRKQIDLPEPVAVRQRFAAVGDAVQLRQPIGDLEADVLDLSKMLPHGIVFFDAR